ncbi:hypothetical protein G6F46_001397 [Rhizopus delemar]|uniref:Uncharacterized protein n=2 Tax=Rhizopus TaxID=4842 RepID=A0A9P6ZCM2_9FUNG|nr:hypothetical protein G6F55_006843 [Rhizopus delemar]KAG1547056.1 hypothetical protein G6F51_004507 [Rhizopus arrhizus]KAG1501839.1 hypothetical protein G6F54_002770 [Rhizopus delemar]KAG1515453.1 hypothetical protein G6F52_009679 [Rhizopus delemar]KAG1517988.1 hypothetical protein G6F53_000932 [Rhizopus delemar]
MGFTSEKCCCFIPLRLGAFVIALWFFVAYFLDAVTGFLGINAVVVYSGQTVKAWYYVDLIFTIMVLVGGLSGIIGTLFAQRKSAKLFSFTIWICCLLSFVKYVASLALMIIYRQNMINTCIRSGFVSFNNAQTGLVPSNISTNGYYTPVKYPNTLNAHATSAEDCQQAIRLLIITWGVIIFVVQLVQLYFATVVSSYANRLSSGARHHRLHDQQIKDFEESRFHMSTVY